MKLVSVYRVTCRRAERVVNDFVVASARSADELHSEMARQNDPGLDIVVEWVAECRSAETAAIDSHAVAERLNVLFMWPDGLPVDKAREPAAS